jgi:CHASE3 domain sensor protein
MKKFLTGNWIIIVIGISFITSTLLAIRNNYIIERNHIVQQQADLVKQRTRDILTQTMHGLDLGVRGFGLTRDDKLLIPYNEAIRETAGNIAFIDSMLLVQNYEEREKLQQVRKEIDSYVTFSKNMIQMARNDQMTDFASMLAEDRGYNVWASYSTFASPLFAFEDHLREQSLKDYQDAIRSNLVIQIVILILVMPMLYMFVAKVNNERKRRELLLKEVDKTDRTYVFNPGDNSNVAEDINQRSIEHVKRASEFISSVASGNYDIEWRGLTDENKTINKQTLAGNLLHLRDRLKAVKQEDERRNWANENLARFSEIVRNYQGRPDELAIKTISFLTQAIDAQQGSLFIREGEGDEAYLHLAGCYAFNKKKWIEKRIEIGAGLVGQAYLEGEPVLLKQIPKGYTSITSGLGDATPTCLIIIPMKHDDQTIAVSEFATFNHLERHHVSFLQKAGEYLASAMIGSRNTLKMKQLLEEAKIREEEMKQREEELRQNMEELQATQEELVRKQEGFLQKSA